MKRSFIAGTILCFLFQAAAAFAAEEASEPKDASPKKSEVSEILDSMGYPELQVVPRATERLAIEAKIEDSSAVVTHWPIQFSGFATLIVGITSNSNLRDNLTDKEKSDSAMIGSVTTAVGLGWIVGSAIIGAQRPYRAGLTSINKYPGKDERSALLRERLAEEALERPARVWHIFENVSVITNLGVCIGAAWHANETGKIIAGVGAIMAFVPYVFEDHSVEVYEKHIEYKKKIYTPVKSASFQYESKSKTFTPMTNLAWEF